MLRAGRFPSIPAMPTSLDFDLDDDPALVPTQRTVAAAAAPFPQTSGFVSVFDWAAMFWHLGPLALAVGGRGRKANSASTAPRLQDAVHLRIERHARGVTVRRVHYLDCPEWREREAQRRARQQPPKPPAQDFRMRGSLVSEARSC